MRTYVKYFITIFLLSLSNFIWALTCTAAANPVAFGNYNVLSTSPTDSTATLSVTCSDLISILVSYTINLSQGSSATYIPRVMLNGANQLQYNLYTTAARNVVWGNGSGGTSNITDSYLLNIFSITRSYTVYGRIPAQQTLPIGSYSDTITMTVIY